MVSLESLAELVDLSQTSLLVSILSILFNPVAWNIVAQNEYRNKTITRMFGGNGTTGATSSRVHLLRWDAPRLALPPRAPDQPQYALLPAPFNTLVPAALFLVGQTFVLTSTWALGVTGTSSATISGFPFNVLRDPMYVGSTMSFAATALWYERPAGLVITAYVYIIYIVALRFEGPFTDMIYLKREEERKLKKA
ncbi:phospholipid methyltransferase [Mycena leptocephala]|nr:phospholipid methyltransferase [Mycena leptocephala]